jgi:hypothetical protein
MLANTTTSTVRAITTDGDITELIFEGELRPDLCPLIVSARVPAKLRKVHLINIDLYGGTFGDFISEFGTESVASETPIEVEFSFQYEFERVIAMVWSTTFRPKHIIHDRIRFPTSEHVWADPEYGISGNCLSRNPAIVDTLCIDVEQCCWDMDQPRQPWRVELSSEFEKFTNLKKIILHGFNYTDTRDFQLDISGASQLMTILADGPGANAALINLVGASEFYARGGRIEKTDTVVADQPETRVVRM